MPDRTAASAKHRMQLADATMVLGMLGRKVLCERSITDPNATLSYPCAMARNKDLA